MRDNKDYINSILVRTEGTINDDVKMEVLASAVIFNACKEYKKLYLKYLKLISKEQSNPNIKLDCNYRSSRDTCKYNLDEVSYFLKHDELYWPFISSTAVRDKVYLKLKDQVENEFRNKFAK